MQASQEAGEAFLETKFRDHERYTLRMSALFGLAGLFLWVWDYVIDPVGARRTALLRILLLLLGLLPMAVQKFIGDRRSLTLTMCMASLVGIVAFFIILMRLNGGMVYGIGGFMFFQFIGLIVLQGCSFPLSVAYHIGAALVPNAVGLLVPAAGFEQTHYTVLLWPAAAIAVIVQHGMNRQYMQSYALRRQLEFAALTDALTGTYNRRYFSEIIVAEMARVERDMTRLSLLLVDIDLFKEINDRDGHAAGDAALKAVAAIMKSQMRPSDRLFRWGGDEFVVLAPSAAQTDGLALAERLRRACESADIPFVGTLTLSIGVAEFAGDTMEEWVARADQALYAAKQHGRNRVESAGRKPVIA